ncbi:Uncharacterised protein [Mycobacterium tuberculosis]|nr:Uncharacterised protein [Mycobacterium tuberculosis]
MVRSIGIGESSRPSPRGGTSRNLLPNKPLVLIATSVRFPSRTSVSTLNSTSTPGPSSEMLDTFPTG